MSADSFELIDDTPCRLCGHTPRSREQHGIALPLYLDGRPKAVVCLNCYWYSKPEVLKLNQALTK
jgi:hypothetical protein